jgi:ATP-binding cassette, subfamily B, multidrug efflux pump
MARLLRYLKPYWWSILLVIGLLFAQAMADLALPNYMSNIVNVGIQQGGMETAVPVAVRQSQMEKLTIFLTPDEQAQVLSAYTLVQDPAVSLDKFLAKDAGVPAEPVYVLNDLADDQLTALTPVIARAELMVYMLQQAQADPAKAAQYSAQAGFDLTRILAGTDIFAMFKSMPPEQLNGMVAKVTDQLSSLGPRVLTESAIPAVKAEYLALGIDIARIQSAYILRMGGIMLLYTILIVIASVLVGLLAGRSAAGVAHDLRKALFTKVESFSKAEFEQFSTASLITRSTNDVTQMQQLVFMLQRMIFYAPIIGIGAVIRAVQKSPSMTWIIGLGVAILLILIITVFSVSLPKFKLIQTLIDKLNLVTRESLSGLMVIRSFNTQQFELQRFDQANKDLTRNNLFVSRVMVIMMPLMMLLMNGISVLIIWVGAHRVADSLIQVGDMMAFLQYAMQVVFSFLMMSFMFIILPRAAVSANRIADVLAIEPTIKDPAQPKSFDPNRRGEVEFRNVSFRYPGAEENVICNISFTAKPGETTAIIGSTGSGKSTVVNLIPRFFDVTEGEVLVDGRDVREVAQADLRERIGYIPQRGILFSGTVQSNLAFAAEQLAESDLQQAVETAQASEFIKQMDGGMQAPISQGGANVSGGQKQRLAIARALVKHPPIYIFDDALSALDFKTDAVLRRALKNETEQSTMIIVTQRVSTIRNAEQIVVLDDGVIAGKGTHNELLRSCDTYREMVSSQLTREELSL